jgi:predicted lipoprotein with Yx(FWY)xxD motif
MAALMVTAVGLAACGGYGGGGTTAGPGATGASTSIGEADVGSVGEVLVNGDGFTLYHMTTETADAITCTGQCASTWPPVLARDVPDANGLTGTFGIADRPGGGRQVTYDGFPLYTYSGDSAAGQANGQGVGGVWFAVPASASSAPAGGGDTGGGYGGYGGKP